MFKLPRYRPPYCAYRCDFSQGSQAVYTTHRPEGYPFWDVASLRVRHEQLTPLDFHQLDRSLVGCSPHPGPTNYPFRWGVCGESCRSRAVPSVLDRHILREVVRIVREMAL
jgi:hypothetical protein